MGGTPYDTSVFRRANHGRSDATIARQGGSGGFDPGAYAMGEFLRMYNDPGQYSPGSAGGFVSRAPQRAAAQAGYNQAEADRSKVYGQVDALVRGRNPEIVAGYDRGSATLQANARQRAIADRAAASQQDTQAANAAQAMGLPQMPPTADTQADAVREGNIGQYQTNADTWQGFNDNTKMRAVERNDAVGDAFVWQGDQQRQALSAMLLQALSGLGDYATGGSAGGFSGGLTNSQKLSALNSLRGYSNEDVDNDLNASKFLQSTLQR